MIKADIEKRQAQDDLFSFVSSRQWQLVTVALPTTPNTVFEVKHKFAFPTNRVRWEVLQSLAPIHVYQHPDDFQIPGLIKLRATQAGGEVRLLLTIDDEKTLHFAPAANLNINSPAGFTENGRSAAMGEWTSFTPGTVAVAGGGSIGSGTATGSYTLIGDMAILRFNLENYTISTAAATNVTFTIPITTDGVKTTQPVSVFVTGTGWIASQANIDDNAAVVSIIRNDGGTFPTGAGFFVRGRLILGV